MKYVKTLDFGSIAGGSAAEQKWTPEEDVHIKRIIFVERSAQSLANVDAYIKFGEDVLTRPSAPAQVFGQDPVYAIVVDRDVPKGLDVYIKLQNNGTSAVNVVAVIEVTE